MTLSLESFIDELEKISSGVRLSPEEKKKQMAQFAGLGAATVPGISALGSKIQSGRWMPKGVKSPKRWLAGSVAQGLFWGGALPTMQHAIARSNLSQARDRVAAERAMRYLAPGGVRKTLESIPTSGVS